MSKRPGPDLKTTTVMTCALSGFEDTWHVGVVHDCYIFDEVLCCEAMKDTNQNRIQLTASIRALWRARLLVINPDGTITTSLDRRQLKAIGLSHSSRLPKDVLTPERVKFLEHRINDRAAFDLASQLSQQRK